MKKIIFIPVILLAFSIYSMRDDKNNAAALYKGGSLRQQRQRLPEDIGRKFIRKKKEPITTQDLVPLSQKTQSQSLLPSLLTTVLFINGKGRGGKAQYQALKDIALCIQHYGDPNEEMISLEIEEYDRKRYAKKFNKHYSQSFADFDEATSIEDNDKRREQLSKTKKRITNAAKYYSKERRLTIRLMSRLNLSEEAKQNCKQEYDQKRQELHHLSDQVNTALSKIPSYSESSQLKAKGEQQSQLGEEQLSDQVNAALSSYSESSQLKAKAEQQAQLGQEQLNAAAKMRQLLLESASEQAPKDKSSTSPGILSLLEQRRNNLKHINDKNTKRRGSLTSFLTRKSEPQDREERRSVPDEDQYPLSIPLPPNTIKKPTRKFSAFREQPEERQVTIKRKKEKENASSDEEST